MLRHNTDRKRNEKLSGRKEEERHKETARERDDRQTNIEVKDR
jgi:hypothetical protein